MSGSGNEWENVNRDDPFKDAMALRRLPVYEQQDAGLVYKRIRHSRKMDTLRLHRAEEVVYLTSPILDALPGITHGFTTRLGGVSEGEIGTMNLSFARDEEPENVRENYRRIGSVLGFDPAHVVLPYQTHTNHIRVVTQEDAGKGYGRERDYRDVDGLVTDVKGITLTCFGADCVTLLAADPKREVIGCAHSGWRGTVSDIGGNLIRRMEQVYGCNPADIRTVIGPSICQNCYEVSEDVITQFAARYAKAVHHRLFYRKENGRYQLNLWEACRENFLLAGVLNEHISMTDLCTCCNPQLLYSHRVQKGRQTNLAGLIQING